MIHEVIVTTFNKKKEVHIAPMGVKFIDFDNRRVLTSKLLIFRFKLKHLLATYQVLIFFAAW